MTVAWPAERTLQTMAKRPVNSFGWAKIIHTLLFFTLLDD